MQPPIFFAGRPVLDLIAFGAACALPLWLMLFVGIAHSLGVL